jgi:hypothetical protein
VGATAPDRGVPGEAETDSMRSVEKQKAGRRLHVGAETCTLWVSQLRMLLQGGRCSGKQRVTPAVRVVLDDAGIHTRGHACVEAASHPKAKTKTGAALAD